MSSFLELPKTFIKHLKTSYYVTYGNCNPHYVDPIGSVANGAIEKLAQCDAPYHDTEHTLLVTLTGQEILRGKQRLEGGVTPETWLHSIISWLLHDIGYVKGVCARDCVEKGLYATGIGDGAIALPPEATAASLTPYHVDRGKQFARESLGNCSSLDLAVIERNIELTRFPVPKDELHADTLSYAGLTRAADLIGQLGDPHYLEKLPALYREFEEIGANISLGCRNAADLRASYPNFFWKVAYPYLKDGLRYLKETQLGKQMISNLYANVFVVERELHSADRARSTPSVMPSSEVVPDRSDRKSLTLV
jgi:hypothetical protein